MKFFRFFQLSILLAVILAANSAYGISIRSDYDQNYDLSKLRSFSFLEQKRSGTDPLGTNTIAANRIRDSLSEQLRAHKAFNTRSKVRRTSSSPFTPARRSENRLTILATVFRGDDALGLARISGRVITASGRQ